MEFDIREFVTDTHDNCIADQPVHAGGHGVFTVVELLPGGVRHEWWNNAVFSDKEADGAADIGLQPLYLDAGISFGKQFQVERKAVGLIFGPCYGADGRFRYERAEG